MFLCCRNNDIKVEELSVPVVHAKNPTVLTQGYYNSVDGAVLKGSLRYKDPPSPFPNKIVEDETSITSRDISPLSYEENSEDEENKGNVPTTRIRALADAFDRARVLVDEGEGFVKEIDCALLLEAVNQLVEMLRTSGDALVAAAFQKDAGRMEAVYNETPDDEHRRTVIDLLHYEKSKGVHSKAKGLKEESAAFGLLWMRRNIACQYKMYSLMIEHDMGPVEAAMDAFRSEIEPHLGWAAKKAAALSIKLTALKSTKHVLAKMGGYEVSTMTPDEQEATRNDLKYLLSVWRPLLGRWVHAFVLLDLEADTQRSSMVKFRRAIDSVVRIGRTRQSLVHLLSFRRRASRVDRNSVILEEP